MIFTILICLTFLIYGIYRIIKKKMNLFSPDILMSIVIPSTVLLSCTKLSGLQHNFTWQFNVVLLIFLASFVISAGPLFKREKHVVLENRLKLNFNILVLILFLLVLFVTILTWIKLGLPPAFGGKVIRSEYYLGKLEFFYLLIYYLIYLILYDRFNERKLGKSFYIYMIGIIIIVISKANKFTIFYILAVLMFLYHHYRKKITFKHVLGLFISTIIIFVLSFTLLYNKKSNISFEKKAAAYEMRLPSYLNFLTDLYTYIAFNYENFNYYIMLYDNVHTNGYYTFKEINKIIGLDDMYNNNPEFKDLWNDSLQKKSLTTGSIFKSLYIDFSFIGVLVAGCILGSLSKFLYDIFLTNKKNAYLSFIYLLFVYGILLSFFTNFFGNIVFLVSVFIDFLVIIYKYKITIKWGGKYAK